MKARNRDINIFSLSLMDVISGAMGAFLIIMIILAQYYVFDPETSEDAADMREQLAAAIEGLNRIRSGTEGIFSDLIESRRGAATAGLGPGESLDEIEALSRGIREDIDRVNGQLAYAQGELNRIESEMQEKSAQLQRAEDVIETLETRHAFAVSASWNCDANVDLFVESDRTFVTNDQRSVFFDPRVRQEQSFAGDAGSDTSGSGSEMQMVGETPKSTTYKFFVNLLDAPAGVLCRVYTHAIGFNDYFALLPATELTPENPFDYLGVISVDDDFEFSYEEPSEEERRAEIAAVRERMATTPKPKGEGE